MVIFFLMKDFYVYLGMHYKQFDEEFPHGYL